MPLIVDGGHIVNLSSGLARFSLPGYAAYAVMKGAVEVLTRYLAQELGPRRIMVNTVAPGAIETDFGGGVVRDDPGVNAFVASSTAMERAGLPGDIGGAISTLLVGDFQWMTAQRLEVSGGQNLWASLAAPRQIPGPSCAGKRKRPWRVWVWWAEAESTGR